MANDDVEENIKRRKLPSNTNTPIGMKIFYICCPCLIAMEYEL